MSIRVGLFLLIFMDFLLNATWAKKKWIRFENIGFK